MSKISKIVDWEDKVRREKPVENFMGGISYQLDPLETLKMISASSIFGEPAYYRNSGIRDGKFKYHRLVEDYGLFLFPDDKTTSEIMIMAIEDSLEYDFMGTIEWAKELRNNFYMRLNPQVIMVLAAINPKREEFSKENPSLFRQLNCEIMARADEPASQLSFYLYYNKSKNKIPSILKRSWADRIEKMTKYEIAKYKNKDIGLIDVIRICHANNPAINELMTTGTIEIEEEDKTWENLRSEGKSFKEILRTIDMPHMALLRNLKNIFKEIDDLSEKDNILAKLKSGVKKGKQFPFRYYTALQRIEKCSNSEINFKASIMDALEDCIDISSRELPMLKGRTMCLSDNSGSAWGAIPSEYGSVTVAEIGNLSSVMVAHRSDEGCVGAFGDRLKEYPILKKNGILSEAKKISEESRQGIGMSTENGIWLFFLSAIREKTWYDNIFIYSDQQAGHGGLYGKTDDYIIDGTNYNSGKYVDVMKLINKYRAEVNPKVNVFMIQTAGYNNALIPEYIYRGAVLYGWTGKELLFASELIKQWDNKENKKEA